MNTKFYWLFSLIFLPLFAVQVYAQPDVTPALQAIITEKDEDHFISVNIRLGSQYDDQELYRQSRNIVDREERRDYVVNELKQFSRQEQADLLAFLEKEKEAGHVKDIRPLWVGNLVNCKARPGVIRELMSRKDLARVDYNQKREVLLSDEASAELPVAARDKLRTDNLAWNVTLVNADQVWDEGFTGEDVIVAVLDTGVNHNHQDLQGNMWTHPDYPNHGYNFVDDNHNNMDNQGHGTHCAGTIAGTGAAGTGTGMAPDASIMNLKVLDGNSESTEADVWEAIQFSIDYGAHIMSLSLGWMHQWNPDRSMWRTTMNNARNAGVIASVASGNEGGWGGQPPPNEVRTPGDVPPPWLHPDQTEEGGTSGVVSVGSTTSSDNLSGFSSKGPVTWQNVYPFNDYDYSPGSGLIRPDIVAPGSDVISLLHSNTSGYTTKSGTSMATPAVAGVTALMLSKNQNLLPEDISQILEETAESMTGNKSNSFGSGRLDAFAAIQGTPFMGVHYISHEIDDSEGNDDGHINPGEEIQLDMTFKNPTEDFLEDVAATLSVHSPYITVTDSILELGDFPSGEVITVEGAFTFEVADNIPGGYDVQFVVNAYAAEDPETKWASDFYEMAHAPFLQFSDLEVDDAQGGNDDGMLDPGETADLYVTLTNTGQLVCEETEVLMVPESDLVMVLTHETQTVSGIEPGESEDFVFQVAALYDAPPESTVELLFSALTGAYAFEQTKEVVVGEAPYYDEGDIPSTYNSN
ncbi:MAG: S8 family serine peptidase, partial [Bacteroidota bacterium]